MYGSTPVGLVPEEPETGVTDAIYYVSLETRHGFPAASELN